MIKSTAEKVASDKINSTAEQVVTDKINSTADLKYLFSPRSVAVIGASDNPDKAGGQVVDVLINSHYDGATYFINQRLSEIKGQKTYKSITEVEEVPDLADDLCSRNSCPKRSTRVHR